MHFEPSLLNQRFFLTKVVGKKMDMHWSVIGLRTTNDVTKSWFYFTY
jgi:hypothetical protein